MLFFVKNLKTTKKTMMKKSTTRKRMKKEKGIQNEETLPVERHSPFLRFPKIKPISL